MIQRLTTTLLLLLLTARLCGAAITAATVWEVRPTNGDNTFGACFDSTITNAGTDYSQQTTAQLALTDIAITTTAVTSVTGGFTSAMIGNCLRLNATGTGAHCVLGWYQITAFTSSNAVTIDRDATTGGAGVACSGKVGGATKSLSGQTTTAITTSTNAAQAGNKIWVKNEAWNEAITTSGGNNGTAANPILVVGYNTARGDNPTGSNRPRNNRAAAGSTALFNSQSHYEWQHLWMSNAGTIGIQDTGGASTYVNVRSSNNTTTGFTLSGGSTALVNCEADTNTTNGITSTLSNLGIYGSYIHGNTLIGLSSAAGPLTVAHSIIAANASHGIAVITGNQQLFLFNNTIDGNTGASTDGLNVATAKVIIAGSIIVNNIFSNNGRDGVRATDASSATDLWTDYNNFSGNSGTTRTNFPTGSHDIALSPGYVSTGTGNFAVGANMRNKGFPGTFPASTTIGYLDIGAAQTGLGGATQRATGCVQ